MQKVKDMREILERIERMKSLAATGQLGNGRITERGLTEYECSKCKDTEFVQVDSWTAMPCTCRERKVLRRRMKNALVPAEFEKIGFRDFIPKYDFQRQMLNSIKAYLRGFDQMLADPQQKVFFGFAALMGEQKIKAIKNPEERAAVAAEYNSNGLGKTHLTIAAAKALMKRDYSVLCVTDVGLFQQLSYARTKNDNGQEFNELMHMLTTVDVLVWDDVGKTKPTEFVQQTAYRIIDTRYLNRKPIIFSTNEDADTLEQRIGYASVSRLFGGCKEQHLLFLKGPDYRQK